MERLQRAATATPRYQKKAIEDLPQLQDSLRIAQDAFTNALDDNQIPDESTYEALILPKEELSRLRELQRKIDGNYNQTKGALEKAVEREQQVRDKNITTEDAESLNAQKTDCEEQLSIQESALQDLVTKLSCDDNNRASNATNKEKQAPILTELKNWNELFDIMRGTKEGFKKYAQRITFRYLLKQANGQLRKLFDRYELQDDPTQELEPIIFDRYQDEHGLRPCSNLSGGETFVVSLALALGLSRMTGETRIDTLFLDEEFGTLDSDALEKVLDSLQEDGKLVGVISHVEALKERIPAHLDIVPLETTGRSTIAAHPAVTISKVKEPKK